MTAAQDGLDLTAIRVAHLSHGEGCRKPTETLETCLPYRLASLALDRERERDEARAVAQRSIVKVKDLEPRLAVAQALALDLQGKLDGLFDYWFRPTEPNDFYINGFPSRIDQLAELFAEQAADTLRAALADSLKQD